MHTKKLCLFQGLFTFTSQNQVNCDFERVYKLKFLNKNNQNKCKFQFVELILRILMNKMSMIIQSINYCFKFQFTS